MMLFYFRSVFAFFVLFLVSIKSAKQEDYEVLNKIKHDSKCFTQGLLYYKDSLVETCGLNGKSSIRIVDPTTGNIEKEIKLGSHLFAEGATIVDDFLYVLTWKNKIVVVVDLLNWRLVQEVHDFQTTTGEGWGLTDDGNVLYVSDGSDMISIYSIKRERVPQLTVEKTRSALTFEKKIRVVDKTSGGRIWHLNELEYVDGYLYANIWYADKILKIHPTTGHVVKTIDMSKLWPKRMRPRSADCLNGIAFNKQDKTFLLTGKLWPDYYKVKLNIFENSSKEDL